ncbi:MAG: hypothetical protein V7785_08100 [Bermanella sp.]
MKTVFSFVILTLAFNSHAGTAWISGTPNHVQLVNGGLVVLGDFSNKSEITCNTGSLNGFYLQSDDTQMDRKLSMALMAMASGRKLGVHIADVIEGCIAVSAVGTLPIAHPTYYKITD